jgi:hypothetical protein
VPEQRASRNSLSETLPHLTDISQRRATFRVLLEFDSRGVLRGIFPIAYGDRYERVIMNFLKRMINPRGW